MNNKTKGFIYGAIAAASYGMNPLFALPLYAVGMSVDTVFILSLCACCDRTRYFNETARTAFRPPESRYPSFGNHGATIFIFISAFIYEL